ncbi:MAG: lysophospholipid acyltransferase family protein [Planctomycetota bacterium]|jgi:KDO2-lipid IV(A) lauroyltransferase
MLQQLLSTEYLIGGFLGLGNVYRRLLAIFLAIAGSESAYWLTGLLAGLLYRLLPAVRALSEGQCRAALAGRVAAESISGIARQSFIHRIWNLTDLMLADRFLHRGTYHRYGGRIPEDYLVRLLDAQRRGQSAIVLTAYYGPFDLLPVFLGYNGVRAGVVYKPHDNTGFDKYRCGIRGRSGCELISIEVASGRLGEILEGGGTVAVVADHHATERGMPATFLGLPTMAIRSVGLLAWRYHADVVVAGIRRINNRFNFEIMVADVVDHSDWQERDDPVVYITERYLRGLERLILNDPAQYLWGYARWGEDFARRLMAEERGEDL